MMMIIMMIMTIFTIIITKTGLSVIKFCSVLLSMCVRGGMCVCVGGGGGGGG